MEKLDLWLIGSGFVGLIAFMYLVTIPNFANLESNFQEEILKTPPVHNYTPKVDLYYDLDNPNVSYILEDGTFKEVELING